MNSHKLMESSQRSRRIGASLIGKGLRCWANGMGVLLLSNVVTMTTESRLGGGLRVIGGGGGVREESAPPSQRGRGRGRGEGGRERREGDGGEMRGGRRMEARNPGWCQTLQLMSELMRANECPTAHNGTIESNFARYDCIRKPVLGNQGIPSVVSLCGHAHRGGQIRDCMNQPSS